MTLREARCRFTECLALLVQEATRLGYEIAFAEGMDRVTQKDTTTDHMPNSLHEIGLAQDVDLYKAGIYLRDTADHAVLGQFWKDLGVSRGLPLTWGGDFSRPDGNHYSLKWNGRA